jgi:hypothetical protein
LHGASYFYSVPQNKEQKIIDRIIGHQLIIMDNPTGQIIEKLEMGNEESSVSMVDSTADKPNIVRPSSLNYKISLLEAV